MLKTFPDTPYNSYHFDEILTHIQYAKARMKYGVVNSIRPAANGTSSRLNLIIACVLCDYYFLQFFYDLNSYVHATYLKFLSRHRLTIQLLLLSTLP